MKKQIIKLFILTLSLSPLAHAQMKEVEIETSPGEVSIELSEERLVDDKLSLSFWCNVEVTTREFAPHVCTLHALTGFVIARGSNLDLAKINLCKKVRGLGLNTKVKNFSCSGER